MAGKIKSNPRYEVVSYRTTAESKERLNLARGTSSISEFVDLLVTLHLQQMGDSRDTTSVEHTVCSTPA